jgi:hypothetical protein
VYGNVRHEMYSPITVNTAAKIPKTIAMILSVDMPELLSDKLEELELLDEAVPVFAAEGLPEFMAAVAVADATLVYVTTVLTLTPYDLQNAASKL